MGREHVHFMIVFEQQGPLLCMQLSSLFTGLNDQLIFLLLFFHIPLLFALLVLAHVVDNIDI